MPPLKDSKTEGNLKEAFAGESQANRRYLYFAQKADVEGYPDVAALFRSVAEGETGHAFGHFDYLKEVGDPVTGVSVGPTEDNLKSAIEGETYEYTEMYPGFAKTAREEGFEEIAEWFETLARAEKSHAGRFNEGLAVGRLSVNGRIDRLARPAETGETSETGETGWSGKAGETGVGRPECPGSAVTAYRVDVGGGSTATARRRGVER